MTTKQRVEEILEEKNGSYISGEELSKAIGVSRAAIWKAVESLRDEGLPVGGRTRQGYRMEFENGQLNLHSLQRLLPSCEIHFFDRVDSTNHVAKELAMDGARSGTLVIARTQEGGRGRLGRFFSSPHGGIYLTLVIRPTGGSGDALLLTSAAAVSTALAIQEVCDLHCDIKWVNDLLFQGKKVTGILTEGVIDVESGILSSLVVGIGINFCTQSQDFPPEVRSIAGSLYGGPSQVPQDVDQNRLVSCLVKSLLSYADTISEKAFLDEYRRRCVVLGKRIRVIERDVSTEVLALSIDDDAHLVVRYDDGHERTLSTGEISIRLAQ